MSRSSSGRQDGLDGKLDWVAGTLHGVQLDRYRDMIERFGRDALDLVFNRIPLNCGIRLWSDSRGNALYQKQPNCLRMVERCTLGQQHFSLVAASLLVQQTVADSHPDL
jgi:hypothetical protein